MAEYLFWVIAAGLAFAVVVTLVAGLGRRRGATSVAAADLGVYRDQLAEVERDLARGIIATDEAARLRIEIGRRVLAADRALLQAAQAAGGPGRGVTMALVGGVIVIVGLGSYAWYGHPGLGDQPHAARIAAADAMRADRPDQAAMVAVAEANHPPAPSNTDHARLVEQLRLAVANRPNDLQGHELLARNEALLGNFTAAAEAMAAVVRLKGDAATATDLAAQAELMIMAAGGRISPEADAVLAAARQRDPHHGLARYYSGLMLVQTGRYDLAFPIWAGLWQDSTADDPWAETLGAQLPDLAWAAGQHRYELPPLRGATPTAAEVAAMDAAEQAEMIRGMVDGLLERLADEGGTAAEWAQAIHALAVLGELDRAMIIRAEARTVFADRPEDLRTIASAARDAGLPE